MPKFDHGVNEFVADSRIRSVRGEVFLDLVMACVLLFVEGRALRLVWPEISPECCSREPNETSVILLQFQFPLILDEAEFPVYGCD